MGKLTTWRGSSIWGGGIFQKISTPKIDMVIKNKRNNLIHLVFFLLFLFLLEAIFPYFT